jgi:hypothetical protein
VAGVIGRGLAVGLGVGVGDGDGVGDGVGDTSPALPETTAGLDVVALEQATTASIRKEIEPIRARRPVRTLSSQIIYSPLAQ